MNKSFIFILHIATACRCRMYSLCVTTLKAYYCACLSHITLLQYDRSLPLCTLADSTVSVWGRIKCSHQLVVSIRQHSSTPSCCYRARPSASQSPPCLHRLLSCCHRRQCRVSMGGNYLSKTVQNPDCRKHLQDLIFPHRMLASLTSSL